MKRKLNSVLRSQTGASITFALLLFLICSLVGALVITAGTTAAGRMANLAEMDQRFYSVSSAAKLLEDELNNQSVTITRVREMKTVTESTYITEEIDGRTVAKLDSDSISSKTYYKYSTDFNGEYTVADSDWLDSIIDPYAYQGTGLPDMNQAGISFLTGRATLLLLGDDMINACNNDAAMDASMKNGTPQEGEFLLSHNRGGDEDQDLAIFGIYEMKSDGTLVLTLQNQNGDPYQMRLTLHPSISETKSEDTSSTSDRVTNTGGFKETVTSIKKLTKVFKITWTVSSVEKIISS